jgi:N-acylneuraminate cytidylyltransferase/CMP-N,N'-diacetyllegionaminic acid synthase
LNILGLIPARSGSKGIPGKNIRLLKGKPLICYTIEVALTSKYLNRTIISTDSDEIAAIAREANAEVPFIRPAHLADDNIPMYDVMVHAVHEMKKIDWMPDILVLLQPTSPFRTVTHLDEAIEKFQKSSSTCLVSVKKVKENPYWMKSLKNGYLHSFLEDEPFIHSRQSLPVIYYPNGAIFIWKTDYLLSSTQQLPKDTTPFEMDVLSSLDLDEEIDWLFAEFLLSKDKLRYLSQ